jgi:CelD/BcsL family acetyltransferase involved in cellulose biosynthesis
MAVDVRVCRRPDEFRDLRDEWNALLFRSASAGVTLTWEWLHTWWTVFGTGRELRVVLVREDGRLIGAAPLLVREAPVTRFRVFRFRRMELLASGEPPGHQICSDYIGWFAEPGREPEVASLILEELERRAGEWDELVLADVDDGSPMVGALRQRASQRGMAIDVLKREPCALARLPGTNDEFLEGLGSSLRYRIRRGLKEWRKAEGRYDVVSSPDQIESAAEVLFRLHQARWVAKGRPGAFKSGLRRRFHLALMPLALEQGWLRLGILSAGEDPIGAIYNFRCGGRVFFYQSGITVPANSHLRPGLLMHALEIESAIEAGCREYDFLKRGHSEYKDSWANESRDLVCVRLARQGAKERAFGLVRAGYEAARTMKHRLEGDTA